MNENVLQRYGDQFASKWDKKKNSKFIRIAEDSCSYKCALHRYNQTEVVNIQFLSFSLVNKGDESQFNKMGYGNYNLILSNVEINLYEKKM